MGSLKIIKFVFISRQPEIQVKLKKEISDHYEKHGELTYDNLADLKYLSMVCNGELIKS